MHSSLLYNSSSRLILSSSATRKSPDWALGGLPHMPTRRITSVLFSPMPRSDRTGDDICQSGHVRLAFIMHASLLCIARTTERMYCDFYGRPPRMSLQTRTIFPRDTDYLSLGKFFLTLVRNKGRYYSSGYINTHETWQTEKFYDLYCWIFWALYCREVIETSGKEDAAHQPSKCDLRDDIPNNMPMAGKAPRYRTTKVFVLFTRLIESFPMVSTNHSRFLIRSLNVYLRDIYLVTIFSRRKRSNLILEQRTLIMYELSEK